MTPQAPQRDVRPLLTIEDLALRLGVTQRFIRRLVEQRRVPFLKIGKFVRFDPAEVERWLDVHRIDQRRAG